MPIGALQSFGAFRASAWGYLNGVGALDPQTDVGALYGLYSAYNPLGLAPKVALANAALYREMTDFIDNVGNRIVRVQSDNWSILDKPGARGLYVRKALDNATVLTQQATRATRSYLHVYPTGTTNPAGNTIQYGAGRAVNNNWRLGINVKPDDLAVAARNLMPVMDRYNEINHLKFAAPSLVAKPDSVIVYMRRAGNYAAIRTDVGNAVAGLQLQGSFAPMWNEIAAGYAEASEPPRRGGSFGSYRAIVTYLAWLLVSNFGAAAPTQQEFYEMLGYVFGCFGIPPLSPQSQQAVGGPAGWAALEAVFFGIAALYDGHGVNDYDGRALANR